MISAATAPVGVAVLTALNVVLPVGDAVAPENVGWQSTPGDSDFTAYGVLYPLPGATFDGSLSDPDKDVWWTCQVTLVGANRAQVANASDLVRAAMQPQNLPLTSGYVNRVYPDGGGGITRDDHEQPPVYMAAEIYRVNVLSTL